MSFVARTGQGLPLFPAFDTRRGRDCPCSQVLSHGGAGTAPAPKALPDLNVEFAFEVFVNADSARCFGGQEIPSYNRALAELRRDRNIADS